MNPITHILGAVKTHRRKTFKFEYKVIPPFKHSTVVTDEDRLSTIEEARSAEELAAAATRTESPIDQISDLPSFHTITTESDQKAQENAERSVEEDSSVTLITDIVEKMGNQNQTNSVIQEIGPQSSCVVDEVSIAACVSESRNVKVYERLEIGRSVTRTRKEMEAPADSDMEGPLEDTDIDSVSEPKDGPAPLPQPPDSNRYPQYHKGNLYLTVRGISLFRESIIDQHCIQSYLNTNVQFYARLYW